MNVCKMKTNSDITWKHECSLIPGTFFNSLLNMLIIAEIHFFCHQYNYWWTSAVNKIVNSDHSNLRRPFCSICDQCHASHGRHVTDFRYSQKYFWEIVPWNDFRLTIFSFLEMLVKMGFFISTCILRCHWWWSRQYFVMISSTEQMVCGEDRGYDDAVGHYDTALE